MDKSAIQHIITHTTANQTTNSKGKEKKESDRPEFKVLVVGKAIIQTMYRLEKLNVYIQHSLIGSGTS